MRGFCHVTMTSSGLSNHFKLAVDCLLHTLSPYSKVVWLLWYFSPQLRLTNANEWTKISERDIIELEISDLLALNLPGCIEAYFTKRFTIFKDVLKRLMSWTWFLFFPKFHFNGSCGCRCARWCPWFLAKSVAMETNLCLKFRGVGIATLECHRGIQKIAILGYF